MFSNQIQILILLDRNCVCLREIQFAACKVLSFLATFHVRVDSFVLILTMLYSNSVKAKGTTVIF